jgi:hypothetical protein
MSGVPCIYLGIACPTFKFKIKEEALYSIASESVGSTFLVEENTIKNTHQNLNSETCEVTNE